jgi:hypothetical protein
LRVYRLSQDDQPKVIDSLDRSTKAR